MKVGYITQGGDGSVWCCNHITVSGPPAHSNYDVTQEQQSAEQQIPQSVSHKQNNWPSVRSADVCHSGTMDRGFGIARVGHHNDTATGMR